MGELVKRDTINFSLQHPASSVSKVQYARERAVLYVVGPGKDHTEPAFVQSSILGSPVWLFVEGTAFPWA
jgi:hypothetical protein